MGNLMKKLGNHCARVLKGKPKLKLQRHNTIENDVHIKMQLQFK